MLLTKAAPNLEAASRWCIVFRKKRALGSQDVTLVPRIVKEELGMSLPLLLEILAVSEKEFGVAPTL
ncbi:hypothetical protein [Cupriavidus nantongensis]|uniref:Uncharacterized protein n=1 Tax=Cupriavidus pampae TaxID=659251 RepID=A0ABM8Y2G4_9BURK|nr:hypothetical protein [Cupriavidus nantongensis]CAG9186944.1 hypothetical protein LMG32289_06703 [Cupriavidus pampae]